MYYEYDERTDWRDMDDPQGDYAERYCEERSKEIVEAIDKIVDNYSDSAIANVVKMMKDTLDDFPESVKGYFDTSYTCVNYWDDYYRNIFEDEILISIDDLEDNLEDVLTLSSQERENIVNRIKDSFEYMLTMWVKFRNNNYMII